MKVLVIGNRVPWPLKDGGAIASYNMLLGLSQLGIEIHFVSLNTNKHYVDQASIQNAFGFCKSVHTFDIDTSLSPLKAFVNLLSKQSYHIERFTHQGFTQLIQSILDKEAFDLIHFESLFTTQYRQWIRTDLPCIYRGHNIEYKIWELLSDHSSNPLKKWYLRLLARRLKSFETNIAQLFESVVCISPIDLNDVQTWELKGHLTQLPGGIVYQAKAFKTPNDKLYHLGYMNWLPNQQAMQWFHDEVWPIVTAKFPKAEFFMAGKSMPLQFFNWQDKQFNVTGEVDSAKGFTEDKGILLVPLNSGSGIRMKTIEAMMEGKAVVTTQLGANGLLIEHGRDCLIAQDAESFADAVVSLISNADLRHQIAIQGQATAMAHYENTQVSKQWEKLYQALIHKQL